MEYTREPLAISDRFLWSGEISVATPQAYGVISEKTPQPDYISDEGVLIYKSDRGLVIITGCGHRGIENIVRHCQNITGVNQIYALVGGFHLRTASPLSYGEPDNLLSNNNQKNYSAVIAPVRGVDCGYRELTPRQREM